MKKIKVLIVEDDSVFAAFLENRLQKLGYKEIDIAVSNEEVISYIENTASPDLIFMDIFLRGKKNGIDTALEIYKMAKIPVIFISAPENYFLVEDAKFIKSATFLSKPFEIKDIKKSIENLENEAIKETPEYIEAERLKAIHKYEIIDTPREGNFDIITSLAALLLNVPIALISIVDKDKIWFKSRYGFDEKEIPKSPELFGSSFLSKEFSYSNGPNGVFALVNPQFAHDKGLQFYASAPLLTHDGHNLGTLCVIDKKSRQITETEQKILIELAEIVMDELEMRLAARNAYRNQREFLNTAVHDLKNPLAGILGFSDLINEDNDLNSIKTSNNYIKQSADKMLKIVEGLLQNSLMEMDQVKLECMPLHFSEILDPIVIGNQPQAQRKKQTLKLTIKDDPIVEADPVKMGEALDNLVSNAIKYSPPEKTITIDVKKESGKVYFEVKDEGPGLSEEEKKNVFKKFSHLSARPTGGETSTGLGLSISKRLVEMHGGEIKVESEGKEKGCKFSVELPVTKEVV